MNLPTAWEEENIGVEFSVTPTVAADRKTITLSVLPQVTDLVGWIEYGYDYAKANRPVFRRKSVITTVHINDGETVVLGGLITELTTIQHDKVPILGSIPYIGRLCRSESEVTAKFNLLIFVTAKLVTSRGTLLKDEQAAMENRGAIFEESAASFESFGAGIP